MREFTVPPSVDRGDQVAVLAPASNAPEPVRHVYDLGVERLRERFDLDPVELPTATAVPEWLAENPAARAEDVHEAFGDPDVAAAIANIGGHDQIRLLNHLDPATLGENPTRFYGWSDNTHLALTLWNEGVVSYYGGSTLMEYAMDGEMFEYTVDYLERALFESALGELREPEVTTDESSDWGDPEALETPRETEPHPGFTWAGGDEVAEGRIWGGCLGSIQGRLIADRGLPDADALDGAVLAVETSELLPHPDAVGGTFQALGERGWLERFDAVLVGRATARSHDPMYQREADWRGEFRQRQRDSIREMCDRYAPDAPVVFDLPFGHTYPTAPLPIGGRVEIDPDAERIRFPE